MTTSIDVPLIMTATGPVPTPVVTLQQTLINNVAATNPGYTANLPGSLIEDVSSTEVGGLTLLDQARVDAINSVTPYGANAALLAQLGAQLGIPQGSQSNASVYVVFTGTPGYVIPIGFLVSDGTNQYSIQDGGTVGTGGTTPSLYAVATTYGAWAIPANSINQTITSIPSGITLTVTNPSAGTPATAAESVQDYRSQIMTAQTVTAQATPNFITTLLQKLPGVVPRLISVRQVTSGWEVICGGGDPYQIAGAIFMGTLNLATIVGSTTSARNITVTILDSINTYTVTFVNPPQQVVAVAVTWNTTATNFTAGAQVNQLAAPAIQSYINSIVVGQPINLLSMQAAFENSVSSILSVDLISALTFSVTINGTLTPPNVGTNIIPGNPESYFYASASSITVTQG